MNLTGKRTALMLVDPQHDFIDGALGAPGRDLAIEPLVRLAKEADYVVTSRDWHPRDHCSFTTQGGNFPPHCVKGTLGAQVVPQLLRFTDRLVSKGQDPETEEFSAFRGDGRIGQFFVQKGIEAVMVGGYVAEYCVKATTLDVLACPLFDRQTLPVYLAPSEAIAAISVKGKREAAAKMQEAGADLLYY